jgi:hypothetical protein
VVEHRLGGRESAHRYAGMRALGRLGAGLAGVGAFVVCCALGPAAILGGLGVAAAGLGVGAWIAVGGGIFIVGLGARSALARRRGRARACSESSRADPTEEAQR